MGGFTLFSRGTACATARKVRHCRAFESRTRRLCVGESPRDGRNDVFRVATYNVLAPFLCSPSRFPHCIPEDLQEGVRWERVRARVEELVAAPVPTVLCLQEVSEEWAARLHVLFHRRGWHFAYAMNPTATSAWHPMGVALAWSTDAFELKDMLVARPGGEVVCPQQAPPPSWPWGYIHSGIRALSLGRWAPATDETAAKLDIWSRANRRSQRVLAARLQDKRTNGHVVVATYHMPCFFSEPWQRQVKAIHCTALRKVLARWLGAPGRSEDGRAVTANIVLAGDFNTKPQDSELHLLKYGRIDMDDVAYPAPVSGLSLDDWLPGADFQFRSAYEDALGGVEPPFTNNAWHGGQDEPFRDTIDYILVSPGVDVVGVRQLSPECGPGDPVFPSADEPSDHVLLFADLRLDARTRRCIGDGGK